MISSFEELLTAAREQAEPQRLLFLFAKTDSQTTDDDMTKHRGTIEPIMCVDKLPEELDTFQALVAEADDITKEWNFILIGSLSGSNGELPTSEAAETHLMQMTNNLVSGQNIDLYVIFDRDGNSVDIQPEEGQEPLH